MNLLCFTRTCTSSNTCFPSNKRSWLRIDCAPNVIALFTLLSSQSQGPRSRYKWCSGGQRAWALALGCSSSASAHLKSCSHRTARAACVGAGLRFGLFAFGSASQLEASHACCALSKGERWLWKGPSRSGKRFCWTSLLLISNSACSVGCPSPARPVCDQSLCLLHLHC